MPTLVIIDDDALVREVAEMSFSSAGGWIVHAADSGARGVALAADVAPDVVLLDFLMPDMDGRATLAALRSNPATRTIPVVFVTADEPGARAAAAEDPVSAVSVIAKPYDPMTLPAQVAALIAGPALQGEAAHRERDELAVALAALWRERRPAMLEQVDALGAQFACGDLDAARHTAHAVVGALGAVGLLESSALARAIDQRLRGDVSADIADDIVALRERVGAEQPQA